MRTDPNKSEDFVHSKEWENNGKLNFYETGKDGKKRSNSFSGNERNHLYLNHNGTSFSDVSGLSGADLVGDGRSFAYLDYDKDGWLDIVVASANAPQLQILRNQMGDNNAAGANHITIRLEGSNKESAATSKASNRDGYGAKIIATLSNSLTLYREHHCGAGMAAQNSNQIHLGLGDSKEITELKIIWPSGHTQTLQNLKANSTHTIRETTR